MENSLAAENGIRRINEDKAGSEKDGAENGITFKLIWTDSGAEIDIRMTGGSEDVDARADVEDGGLKAGGSVLKLLEKAVWVMWLMSHR